MARIKIFCHCCEGKGTIEETPASIFNAIDVFREQKTKPSLYDLVLVELIAIADGHRKLTIQQGRELILIKAKLREFEKE